MSNEVCEGFFCNGTYVGAAALLSLAVLIVGFMLGRAMLIDKRRRRRGLAGLGVANILTTRLRGRDLARASTEEVTSARELRRQMDWEREQATHEMMRTGQPVQRQFCAPHNRWCYHAWEDDHPPGGFDNPTVPDDWPPDLSKATRKK